MFDNRDNRKHYTVDAARWKSIVVRRRTSSRNSRRELESLSFYHEPSTLGRCLKFNSKNIKCMYTLVYSTIWTTYFLRATIEKLYTLEPTTSSGVRAGGGDPRYPDCRGYCGRPVHRDAYICTELSCWECWCDCGQNVMRNRRTKNTESEKKPSRLAASTAGYFGIYTYTHIVHEI